MAEKSLLIFVAVALCCEAVFWGAAAANTTTMTYDTLQAIPDGAIIVNSSSVTSTEPGNETVTVTIVTVTDDADNSTGGNGTGTGDSGGCCCAGNRESALGDLSGTLASLQPTIDGLLALTTFLIPLLFTLLTAGCTNCMGEMNPGNGGGNGTATNGTTPTNGTGTTPPGNSTTGNSTTPGGNSTTPGGNSTTPGNSQLCMGFQGDLLNVCLSAGAFGVISALLGASIG